MALNQENIDEFKQEVLIELEKLFTGLTEKYNTPENHDKLEVLLDIENGLKQKLLEIHSTK
jgi:hypothetical protein